MDKGSEYIIYKKLYRKDCFIYKKIVVTVWKMVVQGILKLCFFIKAIIELEKLLELFLLEFQKLF